MDFILKLRLGVIEKIFIFIKFWEFFIKINFFIHFFNVRWINFYSTHTQNKDANRIFNLSKLSCPIRKVNESNNFLLFIIFVFVFWNSSNCISFKRYTMSWKRNNINWIRIFSNSRAIFYHIIKFFYNFCSQVCLENKTLLIKYIIYFMEFKRIFEKIFVFLDFFMWLKDWLKFFRLNFFFIIVTSNVIALINVSVFYVRLWVMINIIIILNF